ncbi:MAG TPA: phytanoyl-CoA dioxygenase family protein [Candidatus Baltobacteraceae bacterium]|nr:phytanoyl-CoA dioxygenase family protein [Candidatus Baltobacteraceae bacterium]
MLSGEHLARYRNDGFIVLPDFKSPNEVAALRVRALEIVDAFDARGDASVFTTRNDSERTDAYFMESGEAVRCFLEEDGRTVNKIGHAMHDLDPIFDRFSRDARLAQIAPQLGLRAPLLYQSMYIFKQPRVGGEVDWHQDAAFFYTDPQSVTAFWFALEDADRSNGCLWVQPGGHRTPLRHRFIAENGRARLHEIDATPWPSLDEAQAVEVRSGTLVVFDGMLPHYSASNRSPHSRHAYTLHAVDANARYSPANWLQRTTIPLRGFA